MTPNRLASRSGRPPPARPPTLVVERLTKRFGGRLAVDDISFTVASGEVFGFLGPNGAGKTTTVRMLGTLIAPSSGTVTVADVMLQPENAVAIRQRIAVMPENPGLYLRLTVGENLDYFAGLYGIEAPEQRIEQALTAVNLAARADDLCSTLSKGLRQRVGLARALLSDPVIVFLDEPTSGLDPVASHEVHGLIDGLRERGVTVFLTTHRLAEAERLCDRVAILNTSSAQSARRTSYATASSRSRSSSAPQPRCATRHACSTSRESNTGMPSTPVSTCSRSPAPARWPLTSRGRSWPQTPTCSRSPRPSTRSKTCTSSS
jgi:ABC-type multidrug transport system ATPase subunit